MNAGMTCRDGLDRLMDYTEDVLDPGSRAALEGHVAGCPRCAAFLRSYTAVPAIVRQATSVTLPDAGRDALRRALASREPRDS